MFKTTLTAATLAMLLAGPAFADDDRGRRGDDRDDRYDRRYDDRHRDWDRDRRYDRDHDRRRYDHRRHDNRDWGRHRGWRHVPPAHFRADYGYRNGYELAWRDWERYGRHNRGWRRPYTSQFHINFGYRSGYEDGWRDALRYYGRGYRPRYWARDSHGGWFFGFHING